MSFTGQVIFLNQTKGLGNDCIPSKIFYKLIKIRLGVDTRK